MHDAGSLKARLLSQLDTTLHHLFPAGKQSGQEFCIGSLAGEIGASLKIVMRGPKAGLWKDFASGESGDILSLWQGAKQLEFKDALADIRTFLGITNVERPPQKPRPPKPDRTNVGRMKGTRCFSYLQERGILEETMRLYRVRTHNRRSEHNTDFLCFDYEAPDGVLLWYKSTGIKKRPDGKKDIWSTPPWWTLWGWWLVKPHHRTLCITEGEIAAMSMHQLFAAEGQDVPCLSLPSGAQNMDWIENDYDALNQFETVYLCTDNDPAGQEAAKKIAQRLGPGRCLRIQPPGCLKDANSFLTDGREEDKEAGIGRWLENAYSFDPPSLCSVEDVWGSTLALMDRRNRDAEVNDFCFPEMAFKYRDGEMTIVSGYKGSGKSTLLYQTHLHEMRLGKRTLICSLEITPEEMLAELLWMVAGHRPTPEDREKAKAFLSRMVTFIRPTKDYNLDAVCSDIVYAIQRYGVTRVVVDSLHYLAPKEAYELQDLVSVTLHRLAKQQSIHLALVAHSAKGEPDRIPYQVEGSGGILKGPDNVMTVWRNFGKEEAIEKAKEKDDAKALENAQKLHDGICVVWHQRLTGKHPRLKLWFSDEARTYRTSPEECAAPPIPDDPQQELF